MKTFPVYLSTDYVFSGDKRLYVETDERTRCGLNAQRDNVKQPRKEWIAKVNQGFKQINHHDQYVI